MFRNGHISYSPDKIEVWKPQAYDYNLTMWNISQLAVVNAFKLPNDSNVQYSINIIRIEFT